MRSLLAALVLVPALLVLAPACGGGGEGPASGDFSAKCELACKPPSGPCGSQDPGDCQQACLTATEGLAAECAQCITVHSGWHGQICNCSGGSCEIDSFGGSGYVSTGSGDPSIMCDPVAGSKCSGFDIE